MRSLEDIEKWLKEIAETKKKIYFKCWRHCHVEEAIGSFFVIPVKFSRRRHFLIKKSLPEVRAKL